MYALCVSARYEPTNARSAIAAPRCSRTIDLEDAIATAKDLLGPEDEDDEEETEEWKQTDIEEFPLS